MNTPKHSAARCPKACNYRYDDTPSVTARHPYGSRDSVNTLITALCRLPGIGPRSAERISYHLLQHDRATMTALADALREAEATVRYCRHCRNISSSDECTVCTDSSRDRSTICVTETPMDVHKIEQTGVFRGRYFVLMGRLSPLDRVTPKDIGLDVFADLLATGEITEIILVLSATADGDTTAHYIRHLAADANVRVTQIARGVPVGSDLEYVDGQTLAHAITIRQAI